MTHCLTSESVLGEAGFTIRATSLEADDPLLSIAMNLNAYELPLLAYDGARPYPWEAPIRLAAIPLKDYDFVAIMHSVYMETDTRGRPNSYFTHVIFVPKDDFSWRTTLKSWGAIQWKMPNVSPSPEKAFNPPRWITQWQNGAPIKLPMLKSLPESGLNDKNFEDELYKYYGDNPKTLEIVLGVVLERLRKKADPEKGTKPIRGYLLPRNKIKENQCDGYYPKVEPSEEDASFWPENSTFRFGKNIHDTLMHLAFIAWFFPEKFLTDLGFSTYEPHKYGVSIANNKLMVGIVHAIGETPDEMMTSQGVEYFPNVSSIDNKDKIWNWCNIQIDRIFKNKIETFSAYSQRLDNIYNSLNTTNGKWDHFDETNQIFDIIVSYNDYQTFDATIALLRIAKKNTLARDEFCKKSETALPLFLDACYGFHPKIQNKEQLCEALKFLFGPEFFDEVKVCEHLTSKKFLQPEDHKLKKNPKIVFLDWMIDSQLKKFLNKNDINNYKNRLLTGVYNLFFEKAVFSAWKNDPARIFQLFHFFFKNDEKENAENILLKTDYEGFAKGFIHRFKNKFEEVNWSIVLPCFMKASLQNKKVYKQIADLYKEDKFLILLQDIINDPKSVIWMPFIQLHQDGDGEECLTLANTLVNSDSLETLWPLLEYLLTKPDLLTEIQVQDFLFSKSAAILKIIPLRGWSDKWLLKLVNQYLLNLDISSLFLIADLNPEGDPLIRVFSELSNLLATYAELDEKKTFADQIKTAIDAIVAINRYAVDAPKLFEINKFEQNINNLEMRGGKENIGLRKVVIDYLATKVKKFVDEDGGYDKAHGKFILLLLSLNHPKPTECLEYLHEKSVFLFDVHFRFVPKILLETGEKSKTNLVFSMLKNKWIQKFSSWKLMDSEFVKVKREVGNRFRLKYMPIANVYDFFGIFFKGEPDKKYQNGRLVALVLFFFVFFFLPLWHLIFTGANPVGTGYLTGAELLQAISFGSIALLWGCNDFFSKANNLCKPEHYTNNIYINWKMIGVALWTIFGLGLSVLFYLSPKWGCPFYAILLFETIWFVLYMKVIYDEDAIDVFLKPGTSIDI